MIPWDSLDVELQIRWHWNAKKIRETWQSRFKQHVVQVTYCGLKKGKVTAWREGKLYQLGEVSWE